MPLLRYIPRCLAAGELLPRNKKFVLRQSFTENVFFNKRLKNIIKYTRRNSIKQLLNDAA